MITTEENIPDDFWGKKEVLWIGECKIAWEG